jgi:hypothetical protein
MATDDLTTNTIVYKGAVKKAVNMTLTTTMAYSRRAMGFLWDMRDKIDPGQVAILNHIHNKRQKKSTEGKFTSTYKLSASKAGKLGYGRLYGSAGSFETLEKECRGTMCQEFYHDIDIVNCHPVILCQFASMYYNTRLVELERYCANRDSYLSMIADDRDTAKQAVISVLYGGRPKNDFLMPLYAEIREFTQFLMQQREYIDLLNAVVHEKNVHGSFLAYICQSLEREVMLVMKQSLESDGWIVDVLAYDGVMVRKNKDNNLVSSLDNVVRAIKEQTDYDVSVVEKAFSSFEIQETKEEIAPGVLKEDYIAMKVEFESNHFYFIPTNQYVEIDNGVINYYDLAHASEYFKQHWRFQVSSKFGDYVEFFKLWREDPTRRSIKVVDFKPTDDPFTYVAPLEFAYKSYTCQPNPEALEFFLKTVRSNTRNDPVLYDWVIKYFAHMLQFPFDVPKTGIVFTGEKGSGKDTITDLLIDYVIGHNFSKNYQSNNQFFDRYDCDRANKFLVKLEEADRKACFSEGSTLKSLITANYNTFNPKVKKEYTVPNYIRYIFTTNGANPVQVDEGERRFVIIPCNSELKHNRAYWIELRKVLFSPEGGLAVAQYLLNIDLNGFDIRSLPPNDYMAQVIESEKSSETRFIEQWDGQRATSADLYRTYRSFCMEEDLPFCNNAVSLGKLLLKFVRDGVIMNGRGAGNKNYYWKPHTEQATTDEMS